MTMHTTINLLDEFQVAEMLGKSVYALRMDRMQKRGCPFAKLGHHVRYRLEDVLKYIEDNIVTVSEDY